MFSFFRRNSAKKLKKQHSALLEEAMNAQRNGNIRKYSQLTAEADEVFKQIEQLDTPNSQ